LKKSSKKERKDDSNYFKMTMEALFF